MTIDAAIPLAAFTVTPGSSYPLSWPYAAGTVRAAVETDAGWTELTETQYSVTPAASDGGGALVLDPAVAALHSGRVLHVRRATPREQGWTGLAGSREKGVEVALDQQVLALQELAAEALRTLRVAGPAVPPAILGEGDTVMWDGERFVPGPDAANIARAEEIAAQAAADAASAAIAAAQAIAAAASIGAYEFADRAAAQAATIPAPQQRLVAYHNGIRCAFVPDGGSTAITTNGGTVSWGPDPAHAAFLQHYGVTTYPSIAEALAAGAAMTSGERAAEQARISAACGETGGDLVIRGFVEFYDKLIFNAARTIRLARDPARDGLVVSSRFNLGASALVQAGTLVSDGAQIDSLHIWCDQPENPADRTALPSYPKAMDIGGIARGRIGLLRLSAVRDGLVGVGNCGGWEIGRLEIGAFGRALHLDGALDQVGIGQVHCWRYGFVSNAQLQAVQEDGAAEAMRLGRMDGLVIDSALAYRTKVVLDDDSGQGLRIDITSLRLDGDGANLLLGRGKSEIGLNYGTELLSAPQQPYKLLCTAGEHVVDGADLVSDAQATVKVTGGHLTVRGKIFNSNLTIGQGAVVEGGTLVMDATRLAWPTGARAVPFVQQSGSGVLRMLDCVVEADTAGEAVRFGTDQPGNYIDLAGMGKHSVTTPSGAHRGMYGRSQRADMVVRCADGFRGVAGQVYTYDGLDYQWVAGATAISDLPNFIPFGFVSPDHFGGKNRSHIEAAWAYCNTLCATSMSADIPAQTAIPFRFVQGRYNYDAVAPLTLQTAGSWQRVEWGAGAICRGVQIRMRTRWVDLFDPYLIGGPYDMEYGIAYEPDVGLGLRGGMIRDPRIFAIQSADKTAKGLKIYGNATHLTVMGGRLYESDFNLWWDQRQDGDSVSGVLMTGTHLLSARVNNIRGGSISESKFGNIRVRSAAQEGVVLRPAVAGRTVLECYFDGASITGNHTDLTTRPSYAITGITDNGAGKARLAINLTGPHLLWAGLRGLTIAGTGNPAYDASRKPGITAIADTYVDTDLDFAGDAIGTLYHCGWDVLIDGVDLVGRVNDVRFTAGNINSLGMFYAYNITLNGTRLKINAFARGCNRISRYTGFRGRAEEVSDEPTGGAWADVPIVGQASGIVEIGDSVGTSATRDTVAEFVMRTPRTSAGLVHNRPVAYNAVAVHGTDGIRLDGPVATTGLISGLALRQSRTDLTPGRLPRNGDAFLMRSVGPLAHTPDGSPALAVIDAGRTPDGSYQLFADGTLHCRATLTSSAAGAVTWTYPYPFVVAPNVNGNAEATVSAAMVLDAAPTERQATISVRDKTDARLAVPVHLSARGRWRDDLGDVDYIRSLGAGVIYDMTNPATLRQDSAGTTLVTGAAQSCGLVYDLGANARHLTQANSGQRPLTVLNENGRMCLQGDGVDDVLNTSAWDLTGATALSFVVAFRKNVDTPVISSVLFNQNSGANPSFVLRASTPTGQMQFTVTAAASTTRSILVPAPTSEVLVGRVNLATGVSQLSRDGTAWVTTGTDNPMPAAFANQPLRLFSSAAAGTNNQFSGLIGFVSIIPAFVTDEQAARLWRIGRGKWGVIT